MKTKTIETLVQTARENPEGFSLSLKGLELYKKPEGYAVSISNLAGKNLKPLFKKVLFISSGFKQIEEKLFIGFWKNPQDSLNYVDLTLILEDKDKALDLKEVFNQISIFDFKTLDSIY